MGEGVAVNSIFLLCTPNPFGTWASEGRVQKQRRKIVILVQEDEKVKGEEAAVLSVCFLGSRR